MNLLHKIIDGKLMLKISGRLDTNTSEELRTYFSNIRDEFRSMVIDLKHLEYVS